MARVAAFLDPWSDPAKKGFQVIQSMLGFHAGGLTGVGLGQGQGKLFFLPEAHTDFTLAVLGEELGFIGVAGVLLIFGFVAFRGLQISVVAKTEREKVIALGVTLIFSLTAFINAGVAMGLLPTKGLGMPFLSYGGSALLSTCFGLGLLLNIDRRARVESARSFIKIHH
jgi:cell division protein FtsW